MGVDPLKSTGRQGDFLNSTWDMEPVVTSHRGCKDKETGHMGLSCNRHVTWPQISDNDMRKLHFLNSTRKIGTLHLYPQGCPGPDPRESDCPRQYRGYCNMEAVTITITRRMEVLVDSLPLHLDIFITYKHGYLASLTYILESFKRLGSL